ncbi:hypothetical protein PAI11_16240 [Patulibacter medicamentivorans]|uniref:Uncharacterized protein n=1 Tax=Patulibacter medicamentivorans TaxID=1097667 RepID=H0E497_9ACTN|nr:hypothetical protein [Patulibacter medicamentivorans]EHN11492.1 hypothetical protein PAI11_16240 [Patulibacter medicamentivorans]
MSAAPWFRIVQLELAGELELPDGRWMVRGHANRPRAVVVVESTERPRRRFLRGRRDEDGPAPLPASRLTVVDADPLEIADPQQWLRDENAEQALGTALELVRRLLHLQTMAAGDIDPRPVRARDLVAASIGYGTGDEASAGRWTAARRITVPSDQPDRIRRSGRGMGSEERLADLLAGRDAVLAAELLTLRARQDLTAGRTREAALQLRVALEAAIAELEPWRDVPGLDPALASLRDARGTTAEIAAAAARGGLDDAQVETLREILSTLVRALTKRSGGRRIGERPIWTGTPPVAPPG